MATRETSDEPMQRQAVSVTARTDDARTDARETNVVSSIRPSRRRSAGFMLPAVVLGVFVGTWYLISYVILDPRQQFLLPPLHAVINDGFLDSENRAQVLNGLYVTSRVALTGLAIAIGLGMLFAIIMSQSRWIERSFYPYAVALQTMPILAMVPLIGFWFGFTLSSRILVCVIISLFPIITNTLFGLKSAEPGSHDLFTLQGANRFTRLFKLQLPSGLPAIFTGFRISAGLSVIGAIVGDFFFRRGDAGLGILIDRYRSQLRSEMMLTSIFWSSMLGIAVFFFFSWLGRRLTRHWYNPDTP